MTSVSLLPATTTTSITSPSPRVINITSSSPGGNLTAAVISSVVIAAVVTTVMTALVNTALARRGTRLEERARVRNTLADAYQAYAEYKEFPYAIRRRRADQKEEERIRLSEELRKVQARIAYYQAWTQAESPDTGAAYNELITEVRRIAGRAMHEAWNAPGIDDDTAMNIGSDRVNLTDLQPAEEKFISATKEHIAAVTASWLKRVIISFRTRRRIPSRTQSGI